MWWMTTPQMSSHGKGTGKCVTFKNTSTSSTPKL